jgi:uncharacterized protein
MFCEHFIDTAIFQRLRNIEQTSMRPLYPSAHHDRFAHSLGVFYLASVAFQRIRENTPSTLVVPSDLDAYENDFLIAALMHDCGHAPFSHTFEEFYNRHGRAESFLLDRVDARFREDCKLNYESSGKGPADHELFSAGIFLKHYGEMFRRVFPSRDPIVVARMITGCSHPFPKSTQEKIENCLIALINGPAIDLDKLDYILRDTWASGANNVTIDVHRLLSALGISAYDSRLVPVFSKSALSVIQSVLDGRNFLYNWVYSHHTVQYYRQILFDAVSKLSHVVSGSEDPDRLIDGLFSPGAFEDSPAGPDPSVYLPSDGDIYYLLKKNRAQIPEVNEILSRQPRRVPLWKTLAEFEFILGRKDLAQRERLRLRVGDVLKDVIRDEGLLSSIMTIQVKPKVAIIKENEVLVSLRGEVVRFAAVARPAKVEENVSYFLVFVPREVRHLTEACIAALKAV